MIVVHWSHRTYNGTSVWPRRHQGLTDRLGRRSVPPRSLSWSPANQRLNVPKYLI